MPPIKLSLFNPAEDRDDTLELDETLVSRLREVVDSTPGLTLSDALHIGIKHVIDNPPKTKGPQPE